jgi:DNA-binding NtrC family response regulator
MGNRPAKILLVEPDADVLEKLVAVLVKRFEAHITCVATGEEGVAAEAVAAHDLVISELELPRMSGLELADQLGVLRKRPTLLLASAPTAEEAVEAMRLGVRDLFIRPFRVVELMDAVERCLHAREVCRQHDVRHQHMRDLLRRLIRDRRELRQRTELICRDLVGAHRGLVERVLQIEGVNETPKSV